MEMCDLGSDAGLGILRVGATISATRLGCLEARCCAINRIVVTITKSKAAKPQSNGHVRIPIDQISVVPDVKVDRSAVKATKAETRETTMPLPNWLSLKMRYVRPRREPASTMLGTKLLVSKID